MGLLRILYTIEQDKSGSTCSYCSPPDRRSEKASRFRCAHLASLDLRGVRWRAYRAMIDRGCRRSGTYFYKLDSLVFVLHAEPTRRERKLSGLQCPGLKTTLSAATGARPPFKVFFPDRITSFNRSRRCVRGLSGSTAQDSRRMLLVVGTQHYPGNLR